MTHKFAIQILASKMLLRDVVWLGIASKLSLLSPYTTLLCYLVTSSFLRQHKWGEKNCKRAENQSYIRLNLETIREKVAHDDNDNNNRDETTVHTLFHIPFHKLQNKHDDRQLHTYYCEM